MRPTSWGRLPFDSLKMDSIRKKISFFQEIDLSLTDKLILPRRYGLQGVYDERLTDTDIQRNIGNEDTMVFSFARLL